MTLSFDASLLRDFDEAIRREWLLANGIGGYAAGTLLGANTRRYHGLLIAATAGLQRLVTFSRVDAIARYQGRTYDLTTAYFRNGAVEPMGYLNLHRFYLDGTIPVWQWRLGDALLEQRVLLAWQKNTVAVVFRLLEGSERLTMRLRLLHTVRDHHGETVPDWLPTVTDQGDYFSIAREAQSFALRWDEAVTWEPNAAWLKGIFWPEEQGRGMTDHESLFQFGDLTVEFGAGETWQVSATTEANAREELSRRWEALQAERLARDEQLLRQAVGVMGDSLPDWIHHLVLAADQFIITVERGGPQRTILAGYPWFTDWGRDTMIALPGLCLATGRHEDAIAILRTFARYVDQGMLPNRFPDEGELPEYNTADATLWFFEAIGRTWEATQDKQLLAELCPVLAEIIHWHQRGTRYNIHLAEDGLLAAGTAGTQLTWMDVKIGDEVPTPRHGKAVELSALWYNALRWMTRFAAALGQDGSEWEALAERTQLAFDRFWNPATGHLFDVLDRDGEDDPTLCPNQLFALSLTHPVLTDPDRARSILEHCTMKLLTPVGLRSLTAEHPAYRGQHRGPREDFDRAYHQGTVWGWLIGPYLRARRAAGLDITPEMLDGLRAHLAEGAVGTVAEIFDGDPPHYPRGCFAQAWSVSELLALWWEFGWSSH
ncbi:MAG: glycogen debranching enzyme family protein [Ardenticatenales bacterium]|nr:glycogen debranching enzyme family protein [Ardenticatenales bacterium]